MSKNKKTQSTYYKITCKFYINRIVTNGVIALWSLSTFALFRNLPISTAHISENINIFIYDADTVVSICYGEKGYQVLIYSEKK